MKNILILTNPIELSDIPISYGLKLAGKINAAIEFIHIIDTDQVGWHPSQNRNLSYPGEMTFSEFINQESERVSDILTQKIESLASDNYKDSVFKVEKGKITEILRREGSKKNNLTLLACHSINITDYNGIDVYSLTEEIKYPLYIIHPETKDFNIENIMVVSGGDIKREKEVLKNVFELAALNSSKVTIAFEKENFSKEGQKLQEENIISDYTVYTYSKLKDLIEYCENRSYLIVVMKENRSFFRELTSKDKTHKIIDKSHIPVLLFHASEI